jgi:hypothetical protein
MKPPTTELGELVAAMATDAINVQLLWNRDHQAAVARFEAMMAHADPETAGLLRPLAPARMVLSSFELSFQALLIAELNEALTIGALPLNLEFSLRHAVRTERYSRISFSVEQVPLTGAVQQS